MKHYVKYLIGVSLVTGAFLFISWKRRGLNNAIDYIDTQEIGNNQGWSDKVFEQMMKDVGWRTGESWCMYFVKAVMLGAYPGKADKIKKILTPSTQQSWKNAIADDSVFKVIDSGSPKPGDIIIWQSTKNGSLGHTGIVWKKSGDKWITVEGNSSFDGDRDGQGVVKGLRTLKVGAIEPNSSLKVLGFLRLKM